MECPCKRRRASALEAIMGAQGWGPHNPPSLEALAKVRGQIRGSGLPGGLAPTPSMACDPACKLTPQTCHAAVRASVHRRCIHWDRQSIASPMRCLTAPEVILGRGCACLSRGWGGGVPGVEDACAGVLPYHAPGPPLFPGGPGGASQGLAYSAYRTGRGATQGRTPGPAPKGSDPALRAPLWSHWRIRRAAWSNGASPPPPPTPHTQTRMRACTYARAHTERVGADRLVVGRTDGVLWGLQKIVPNTCLQSRTTRRSLISGLNTPVYSKSWNGIHVAFPIVMATWQCTAAAWFPSWS